MGIYCEPFRVLAQEAFEQVNKAYEFLSDKSQRRSEGPDPVNLQLILKTQAILFSRHGTGEAPGTRVAPLGCLLAGRVCPAFL